MMKLECVVDVGELLFDFALVCIALALCQVIAGKSFVIEQPQSSSMRRLPFWIDLVSYAGYEWSGPQCPYQRFYPKRRKATTWLVNKHLAHIWSAKFDQICWFYLIKNNSIILFN